uniref:Uncharacterized protein n=1 Tax=Sphaerodactylus townsendi TaxID=933632 RepID=A0ACB8FQX6_9SAUR
MRSRNRITSALMNNSVEGIQLYLCHFICPLGSKYLFQTGFNSTFDVDYAGRQGAGSTKMMISSDLDGYTIPKFAEGETSSVGYVGEDLLHSLSKPSFCPFSCGG